MLNQDLKIELITNKVGMVTYVSPTCEPSSGIAVIHSIDENVIWLFSKLPEMKQYENDGGNPWIGITIQDTNQPLFIGLSGKVRIEKDQGKKRALWNEEIQNWFPGKYDQPDLWLMAFEVVNVRRWDFLSPQEVE